MGCVLHGFESAVLHEDSWKCSTSSPDLHTGVVSNFTELHALTQAACSYVLLVRIIGLKPVRIYCQH